MKNILHVACSPRGMRAESEWLSRQILARLELRYPGVIIVERPIGGGLMAHVDEDYAISQQSAADISGDGTMVLSNILIGELERADALVIGTPVHNYMVPSVLKAWIDHVVRVRRTFDIGANGKIPLLHDRPVFVAVASGGKFSGERSRQLDFLTPYLTAILAMIGLQDVHFFSVQGTAFGPEAVTAARSQAEAALDGFFRVL
ncbi:FMN-dependent NADH-azoreductase [Sphingopyxis fribergensis]